MTEKITEERLREMLAAEIPLGMSIADARQVLTLALEALTRRSSAGVVKGEAKMRQALAVYGQWVMDKSTLGELAEIEARMELAGISLQDLGQWSNPAALSPQEPVTAEAVVYANGKALAEKNGNALMTSFRPVAGFDTPLYLHPAPSPIPAAGEVPPQTQRDLADVMGFVGKARVAHSEPTFRANYGWRLIDAVAAQARRIAELEDALASPSTGVNDAMVERAARKLARMRGTDPDRMEPGDVPCIDGYRNGEPAHFVWRHHAVEARAALLAALGGE